MQYPHKITSTPYSFFEFQADEEKLKSILSKRGISYNPSNRLSRLYATWAKKSLEIENSGITQVSPLETHNLLDLCEMNIILSALDNIPTDILALKWKKLSKGTLNRFEESVSNSEARNTQFELLLYADLLRSGIDCAVCEPNPDILVSSSGIGANIQCKRIFNYTSHSIESNIHNAAHQLRTDHKNNGHLGIIALCNERIFTGGNSFVTSPTSDDAIRHIKELHNSFYDSHKRLWNSKKVLGTANIPMMIFYTSTMALTDESSRFAHVTEMDFMGTIPSEASRNQFRKLHAVLRPE